MAVRPRRTLHFQLNILAVLSLLGLSAFCLAVMFYLGLITGKSLRVPAVPIAQTPANVEGESGGKTLTEEELSFYNLGEQQSDNLNLDLKKLNKLREQTDSLAAEESTPTTTPQAPQTPKSPTATVSKPKPPQASKNQARYTIQVFSSRKRANAEVVSTRLRRNGFPDAYIDRYESADKRVLYRVRVGKLDKTKAQAEALRLQQLDFIESAQITRI